MIHIKTGIYVKPKIKTLPVRRTGSVDFQILQGVPGFKAAARDLALAPVIFGFFALMLTVLFLGIVVKCQTDFLNRIFNFTISTFGAPVHFGRAYRHFSIAPAG